MAAKIGILGESTVTAVGTTTVYTVPASKAARIRIQYWFRADGATNKDLAIRIGMPGTEANIMIQAAADNERLFTGILAAGAVDPTAIQMIDTGPNTSSLQATTGERGLQLFPLPVDFFLSAGDTVRYIITTNAFSVPSIFQVIGVEDDA